MMFFLVYCIVLAASSHISRFRGSCLKLRVLLDLWDELLAL